MIKKILQKLFFFALFLVVGFLYSPSANALELQYPHIPGFGDLPQTLNTLDQIAGGITIPQILQFAFAGALWLAGLMALGALLVAMFTLATSTGSPWKRLKAQQRIRDVLVGMVILLGSYILLANINPQLLTPSESSFKICGAPGMPACSNPDFPTLSGAVGGGTQGLQNGVCIYALHDLSRLDGTPPFDITKNCPTAISIPGNENLYNLPIIDSAGNIVGNYDGKVQMAVVTGNTKATFFQYPNNNTGQPAKGWIEVTVHGTTYTCKQKFLDSNVTQDCLSKVTGDSRNKAGILFINFNLICLTDGCIIDHWDNDVSSIKLQYYGGVGGSAGIGGGVVGGTTYTDFARVARGFAIKPFQQTLNPSAPEHQLYIHAEPLYLKTATNFYGADCGIYVASVVKATIDPSFPDIGTPTQEDYLKNNPNFQFVNITDSSQLRPGDILFPTNNGWGPDGHVAIWLDDPVGADGVVRREWQASLENYLPTGPDRWQSRMTHAYRYIGFGN
ncbi:MAG: hypothetical protein HYV65_01750 [Candidatus Spechtbacteria bacterium]|nr:hypothetical protein [Candidatus Spechtbacteria bacterium]